MQVDPFEQVYRFWKPALATDELSELATYRGHLVAPSPGIHVLRPQTGPRCYRLADGSRRLLLFAAVQAIDGLPQGAEVLAEIRDQAGAAHSYVLWFPEQRCVVVPFDPGEAVESLRLERYMPKSHRTVLPSSVLSAYYVLRPLLPASVRLRLRKALARRADSNPSYLSWPWDQSLDWLMGLLLRAVLLALGKDRLKFIWFWPHGHPWAAVLTHDVETSDGLPLVTHIMDVEQARGLRSSFNFVAKDYEVAASLLNELRGRGFEIGVHGFTHDGRMFARRSAFLRRVPVVNDYGRRWGAVGFRSPATYRNLDWYDALAFEYDSSVTDVAAYEPQPGGCASLFPYEIGRITELPMTVPQDHTLFGLLGQNDSGTWVSKLETIRDAHGMACVLTHPDKRPGYIGRPENEAHYEVVLDLIADSDAWTPLPRDLVRWWRERTSANPEMMDDLEGGAMGSAALQPGGGLLVDPPTLRATHCQARQATQR